MLCKRNPTIAEHFQVAQGLQPRPLGQPTACASLLPLIHIHACCHNCPQGVNRGAQGAAGGGSRQAATEAAAGIIAAGCMGVCLCASWGRGGEGLAAAGAGVVGLFALDYGSRMGVGSDLVTVFCILQSSQTARSWQLLRNSRQEPASSLYFEARFSKWHLVSLSLQLHPFLLETKLPSTASCSALRA